MHAKLLQLCPTLCDPMNCNPPGSSVHGILQVRILEWVAAPFSRGLPTLGIEPTSLMSPALAGGFFTTSTMWEAHFMVWLALNLKNKLSPRCDPGSILTIDLTVYLQQIQEPAPCDLSRSILIKGKGDNLQFWLGRQDPVHALWLAQLCPTCLFPVSLRAGLLPAIWGPGVTLGLCFAALHIYKNSFLFPQ